MNFDTIRIESNIRGLSIAMLHLQPKTITENCPVLFIHGSSFPAALSFGFRMSDMSWMDYMAENNFESFALDFLGYGNADRYPEMLNSVRSNTSIGNALEASKDIAKAVDWILKKTGSEKVILVAHSWGSSVAALYATQHDEKIARLVLFAPITSRNNPGESKRINTSYETMTPLERVNAMKSLTPEGQLCQLEPEIFEDWKRQWLASDPLSKSDSMDRVRYPSGPLQDVEDLLHGKPYYDLSKITSPTLIIRGEWDTYPSNEDAGLLFTQLVNTRTKKYVVIEKGTHVMHLEKNRNQLYEEVNNFIGGIQDKDKHHSIAVIFEVIPVEGKKAAYLEVAASLKPELEKISGFISIERFQSIYHPEKILSLSFWRDEKAIQEWRNLELHRIAQSKGRKDIFQDYHLRIAHIIRDYGMFDRKEAPSDSKGYHN
jgi:pimeloyl-ACP methyl ester carboxylesterase/heme-degrading monooxygenase HmoA